MPKLPKLSPFKLHRARWSSCTLCDLCKRRKHVVLLRGTVPAKVLFVGEAPGESEDVIGRPFVGPAGKKQDYIMRAAGLHTGDYALLNLIACIPRDEQNMKTAAPPKYAIEACAQRFREGVALVQPELIVCLGREAEQWVPKLLENPDQYTLVHMLHPGAILKMHVSQQGLAIQRCIVALAEAWEQIDVPF